MELSHRRAEEQELLDTIIDNLREHHSQHYSFTEEPSGDLTIELRITGDVYRKSDYYEDRPLVLLKKLVQEDFMLVQKDEETGGKFIKYFDVDFAPKTNQLAIFIF